MSNKPNWFSPFKLATIVDLSNELFVKALEKYSATQLFVQANQDLDGWIWDIVCKIKESLFRTHRTQTEREVLQDEPQGDDADKANGVWTNLGHIQPGVEREVEAMQLLRALAAFLEQRMADAKVRELALFLIMEREIDCANPDGDALGAGDVAYFTQKFGVSRATLFRYRQRAEGFITQFRAEAGIL